MERTTTFGEYTFTLNKLDYKSADKIFKSIQSIIGGSLGAVSGNVKPEAIIAAALKSAKDQDFETVFAVASENTTVEGGEFHGELLNRCAPRIFCDINIGMKTMYTVWVAKFVVTGFFDSCGTDALQSLLQT